ncbi:MAG: ABC transporter ATP-binding protein [Phycisphaerales bacterium]
MSTDIMLSQVRRSFSRGRHARGDVLRGLDLEVRAGEYLTLVGASGAGKTTLLRLIAGLDRPDSGDVCFNRASVLGVPPVDRGVALVFQGEALHPHLTARANMALPLRVRRVGRAEIAARIDEAAAALGIQGVLGRTPGRMSGGERRRVALARALVQRPSVLLLDEPLASVDEARRRAGWDELRAVHRRLGCTVVHVTHDDQEAMALGDRIAVLGGGVVQQVGTPTQVWERPANRFVARALGRPVMNMVEGRVEGRVDRREGRAWFVAAAGGRLAISDAWAGSLPDGAPVGLGFRAGAIDVAGPVEAGGAEPALHGVVLDVARLGDRVEVRARLGDAATSPDNAEPAGPEVILHLGRGEETPAIGQPIRFRVRMDGACLFEPGEFGARLG